MVNPSSDSFRNPLRYQGQDYSFAPIYRRDRDPRTPTDASPDTKPKEQQGYYPISSFWSNSTNGNLWALSNIYYDSVSQDTVAKWVLLGSTEDNPVLSFNVPNGVTSIDPDNSGAVTFTSTGGSVVITGSSTAPNNTNINFDVPGGLPPISSINVDANTPPGTDPVVPNSGQVSITGGQVAAGTTANVIRTDSLAANTFTVEVQRSAAAASTTIASNGVSHFNSAHFSVDANAFVSVKNGNPLVTLSDSAGPGTLVSPTAAGNIQLSGFLNEQVGTFAITTAGTNLMKLNPMSPGRWIVDKLSTTGAPNGTHTTIQGALDSASIGDTIIVMPGDYNETLTLKNACNLVAFNDDMAGTVNITGTLTLNDTADGTYFTISGIRFTRSSGSCITHTGTETRQLFLTRCTINVSGTATGITFTNSATSSLVALNYCLGDASDATSKIFAVSGTDANSSSIIFNSSYFTNGGATTTPSTTANTNSTGFVVFNNSMFRLPVTTSGTASLTAFCTDFTQLTGTTVGNVNNLIIGGSGTNKVIGCILSSGTAVASTISTTTLMTNTTITSSNANALDGAGTINYGGLVFVSGSTNGVNTKNLLTVT